MNKSSRSIVDSYSKISVNLQHNTFDSWTSPTRATIDNKNHWSVNNATLSRRELWTSHRTHVQNMRIKMQL